MLVAECGAEWKLKKEHHEDFIKTMENRIMNVMRHVQQRDSKKGTKTGWVARLPWNGNVAESQKPAPVEKKKKLAPEQHLRTNFISPLIKKFITQ